MKSVILTLWSITTMLCAQQPGPILPPSALPAPAANYLPQNPPGATSVFQDNYSLVLTLTDNNAPVGEIELIVASPFFQATVGEQHLTFSGSVSITDAESAIVTFQLGWQTPQAAGKEASQFVASNMQGSVRLKMGDEVQVVRAGSKGARLMIKKLAPRNTK